MPVKCSTGRLHAVDGTQFINRGQAWTKAYRRDAGPNKHSSRSHGPRRDAAHMATSRRRTLTHVRTAIVV